MAKPVVFVLHSLCISIVALPYIQSGCQYEGRAYKEGQDIRLEDPCVKCNCVRGSLVCRLRVCAPQPHPPPPGCWLLRRRNDCCHKLVCSREVESGRSGSHGQIPEGGVKDGCVVNGTVYGEGSAMDTSSHCQYCYCIKGQQHCVKPECLLTEPGCTPVYNSQSCCPAKYNCSAAVNNTSTTPPSVLEHGCLVNGKYYPEGDMVTSLRNNCENCYCMKNKVRCEPIVCSVPLNQKCTPVITNGHCCPTSYNCNPEEFENTNGIDKKKQEVYNVNATWNLPVLHINKYLSSAAYSERSITDSSILSTGNTTLSTISKLDTQNTLQTNKNTSSEISTKNTTISKPMTGNVTSKPSTENTLLKLSTGNTTILAKPSTGSINFSKQTTRNNTAISKPGTTNATVSKPITKNPTVLKQPSTKNAASSKLSAENSTVSKQSAKNSTLSKPSTQNITKSKSSTENITVSKPSTKNSTVSKPNSENATKSKPSTENVMLSIPGSESTTVTKLSTENTNMSKSSTENTELLKPSTENTTELQVNSEVITKPNTHNTSKSKPSAGNTTVQKTTIESAVSKPNTENITLSKISAENTTKPKLPAENTTVSVTTITSANTVTEMSTQTEPVIQTEETASMTTTTESTITTTTLDLAETTIMVMTTTGTQSFNDTENRVASASADEEITTIKTEDYTTTMSHAETTLTLSTVSAMNQTSEVQKKTGISEPIRKIPSELEAILNNTREKDEDYEYDYNEPSLPPSLPNLRIIPFVAADAVVDDPDDSVYTPSQDKMLPTDSPHFYNVAHSNRFSPPIETEGGFVPKEPILDGPFYESKYDVPYHTTGLNSLPLDITSGTILPPITEPPKLLGNEQCLSGGHHYRHGELLTEPTACDLCLCFYGEILCQEPKCPPVKPSCHRIRERERGSCCGKIICGVSNSESPTRVVDHVTPLSQTLQNSVPHLPAFTVADVIVTPDPFRDVIRTEPAPDLPSLIGEIMPYLWEHTTMPTPIMHTRTTPRPPPISTTLVSLINTTHSKTTSAVNKISHGSINQLNDSTIKLVKHKNTSLNIDHKTELNILKKKDEVDKDNYDDNNDKDDGDENNDDDDDSFSFDSVFHYLFNGEPLTKSPQVTTSRVDIKTQNITTIMSDVKNKTQKINDTEEIIEHRSEEDSNSVLDYINNTTSVPSFADKTTSLETYEKLEYVDDTKNANSIETTTNQSSAPVQTTQKYFVKSATTRKHYATKQTTSVKPSHFSPLSVPDPGAVSGLLKLAGCNIYGRMYRVGRIISELSGPCLECMCTEVGVQCRPLKC